MVESRYKWIAQRMQQLNLKGRDLAKHWGVSESSASRFLAGVENQDPAFSRACSLAVLLRMSVDDLAKQMGFMGKQVAGKGVAPPVSLEQIPDNTVQMQMVGHGKVRLTFSQEMKSSTATKIMEMLAQ